MLPKCQFVQASLSLQWRHNVRDGVSTHQRLDCLLNRLFRRRSKKTPKLRVTGFVRGIHRWPVDFPHKGPVTRKMFPFDDAVMSWSHWGRVTHTCVIVTCYAPSHYLVQGWYTFNWIHGNKCQWNSNQKTANFIQENVLQNVVCKMADTLSPI